LDICFPGLRLKENKDMWYKELENGSQIWIGGLDDADRVEKILGNEYSTMYFNECSQIPYHSVTTAMTRLAENKGLSLKAYYDCNPPSPAHWTHKTFIEHINPLDDTIQLKEDNYVSMLMNPCDNTDNLPEGYIEDILSNLPQDKKRRFLLGEWVADIQGAYYEEQIALLEKSEQITAVRYDPAYEVHTWWDIGASDYTSIWFAQYIGREVRLIDFLQMNGKGPEYYVKELKARGYNYAQHNLPHDAGASQFTLGGKTVKDQFQKMWPQQKWKAHKRTQNVAVDIYAARTFLPRCVFDKMKCYDGIEALRNYRKKWDDSKDMYSDKPVHDIYSHAADAFRYLAVGYREFMGENLPPELDAGGIGSWDQVANEEVLIGRRWI